jgi:hypothetical protein
MAGDSSVSQPEQLTMSVKLPLLAGDPPGCRPSTIDPANKLNFGLTLPAGEFEEDAAQRWSYSGWGPALREQFLPPPVNRVAGLLNVRVLPELPVLGPVEVFREPNY